MSDRHDPRSKSRRRAGRPPAGAKVGERVKDYPQLSIRVPQEMKARLNAVSAVTGLAQWRVVVEAINCFVHELPPMVRFILRPTGAMNRAGSNLASYLLFEETFCRALIDLGYQDTTGRAAEVRAFFEGP